MWWWLLGFGVLLLAGLAVLALLALRVVRTGRLLAAEVRELTDRVATAQMLLERPTPPHP